MIPKIGRKPKQWVEEGSGSFGRDELGFEVGKEDDESGRRWCVGRR